MQLTVTRNTVFKQEPRQSGELESHEKKNMPVGTVVQIIQHQAAADQHVKVKLINGESWYIFAEHVSIIGNEPGNDPMNEVAIANTKGTPFKLPGFKSTFYLNEPIITGGNFTWNEATKNGTRIPSNVQTVHGILKIAGVMQDVRAQMGDRPITITSWYRDPITNRRVGGASASRHIVGDAVDFQVQGISSTEVNLRLDSWWGNRGGLASATSFTHIDARGYKARWRY